LFFIALPIGVRVPEETQLGHATSAPENPRLKPKIIWVTLLSVLFTVLWVSVSVNQWIDWHALLNLGR
jgi:predicted secreted protein